MLSLVLRESGVSKSVMKRCLKPDFITRRVYILGISMLTFLHSLTIWHWLSLAALLLIVEILTGSGFLLWIGIAAACVSVVLAVLPALTWPYQLVLFSVTALLSCILWWWRLKCNPLRTDRPLLNQRLAQYVGHRFVLVEPIAQGRGQIRIGDSLWQVSGDDLPAGVEVIVTGYDGLVLTVVVAGEMP